MMPSVSTPFSTRHSFQKPEAEISVREEAPIELRAAIVMLAYRSDMKPSEIRARICEVLLKRPDSGNWSEYPNIAEEVNSLIDEAPWYKVYDVAEKVHERLSYSYATLNLAQEFENGLNAYLRENGIGWQMLDGKIVSRGSEAFAEASRLSADVMLQAGSTTAAQEIHEALADLSRRPHADVTGAIQHAMASLECVARKITGSNDTLGKIIPKLGLPKPMDEALAKLWGFASEQGRHIREGRNPHYDDAELVVTVASAVSTYLLRASTRSGDGA
jgi:AbiJ N-terminal domain 4